MKSFKAQIPIKRGLQNLFAGRPLNSSTEIRLTRLCTQRCRQCRIYEKTTEPATMSWENFQKIATRLQDYGAYIGFISGGEALLVPHLDKILLEAKRIFSLATTLVTGLYHRTEVVEKIGRLALENHINIQTSLDGLGKTGDYLRGVDNFATTVLKHMRLIADIKNGSRSLLYANIVINNLNLEQVPELIQRATDLGWKTTIGVYHSLTATTRWDQDLKLRPGGRLDRLLNFLIGNPDILNLDSFVRGIADFVENNRTSFCPFVDSPFLTTRTTIMEDGEVYLCKGESIGNLLKENLWDIYSGARYHQRLAEYKNCPGCWTTCYTQRYLLVHPRTPREFWHNIKKVVGLRARNYRT